MQQQLGVHLCFFDQCQFGLVSPGGIPMKKATCLLTNSAAVQKVFHGKHCHQSHTHQQIQGSEQGMKRSVWAQTYPPAMVDGLATSVMEEAKNFEAFK